jgi:hypothetical protein
MTDAQMRSMLESTLALQSKNAHFRKKKRPDAKLAQPASASALARLEQHIARLGIVVPPSFVQFLRISDGIDDYMQIQRLSLRSAKQIVDSRESDEEWDDFAPLHEFVIGSGDAGDFIAFDRSRVDSSGEMQVAWIDGSGDRTDFADFPKFLEEQHQFQTDVLAANEADRANLPAD